MMGRKFTILINVLLVVFFIWIVITSIMIKYRLAENMGSVVKSHKLAGWLLIGAILIHILLHLEYYKEIFIKEGE